MTTYAQVIDGIIYNPVPRPPIECFAADWIITEQANGRSFIVVPDGTLHGAVSNGDGTYTNPTIETIPKILSKTAFQDYCVSQLGGGTTGMCRFTEIMDSTRDSTAAAVRFAYARYEAALTFEKTNTETLTEIMAADSTTGHLTSYERTAILDNWPAL